MNLERGRARLPSGPRERGGFTLVELLVVLGVTGVLLAVLVQLFRSVARGVRLQRTHLQAEQTLVNASHQLSRSLGNIAPGGSDRPGPYHLVGVDVDGGFEQRTRKGRGRLPAPHRRSDRLHLHVHLPDEELRDPAQLASERAYVAFWINGRESPRPRAELKRGWGLLKRTVKHTEEQRLRGHLMPYYVNRDEPTPLLDLAGQNTLLTRVQVVAFHLDYLSFRFWHRGSGRWVSCWNTLPRRSGGCPHPGEHARKRWPGAIQFAVRAYDPAGEDAVRPVWHRSTVAVPGR